MEDPSTLNDAEHLHSLGMRRERESVRRWLQVSPEELLGVLGLARPLWSVHGLSAPCWCLLNARRADVFSDGSQGDIDLLAGPIDVAFDESEWKDRIQYEAELWPTGAHPSRLVQFATMRAFEEGQVVWPPKMDFVVGCEAKASWFDPETNTWKATHVDERARLRGQLRFLSDRGVDRIGFIHVASTKPRVTDINPWFQALSDASRAASTFPEVLANDELPHCGIFRTTIGAIPDKPEHLAGAGGTLDLVRAPTLNPSTATAAREWRQALAVRLGRIRAPTYPQLFVDVCERCNLWNASGVLGNVCACSARG